MKNDLKYAQNYCFWGTITFEELPNGTNGNQTWLVYVILWYLSLDIKFGV